MLAAHQKFNASSCKFLCIPPTGEEVRKVENIFCQYLGHKMLILVHSLALLTIDEERFLGRITKKCRKIYSLIQIMLTLYKLIIIDTTINTSVQFVLPVLNREALDRLGDHSNMYLVTLY